MNATPPGPGLRLLGQIPGENVIQEVGDGLIAWGVAVGIVGLVASAIMWALGANSDNYQHATKGKKGVLYVLLAMALIGAAPVLVQWAFDLGGTAT